MKKLFLLISVSFILSGCMTVVSMYVDNTPIETPEALSQKLGDQYLQIGFSSLMENRSGGRELGMWSWVEEPNSGIIYHEVKKEKLWIWIAPDRDRSGAPEIKEKILNLISEIAPEASIEFKEYGKLLDLR